MSVIINLDGGFESYILGSKLASSNVSKFISAGDRIKAVAAIVSFQDKIDVVLKMKLRTSDMPKLQHADLIEKQLGYLWRYAIDGKYKTINRESCRIVDLVRGYDLNGRVMTAMDPEDKFTIRNLYHCFQQCYVEGIQVILQTEPNVDLLHLWDIGSQFILAHHDELRMMVGYDALSNYWQSLYWILPGLVYQYISIETVGDKIDIPDQVRIVPRVVGSAGHEFSMARINTMMDSFIHDWATGCLIDSKGAIVYTNDDITHVQVVGDDYYFQIDGEYYINGILTSDVIWAKDHPFTSIYRKLWNDGQLKNIGAFNHPSIVSLLYYLHHDNNSHPAVKYLAPLEYLGPDLALHSLPTSMEDENEREHVTITGDIVTDGEIWQFGTIIVVKVDEIHIMVAGQIYLHPNLNEALSINLADTIYSAPYFASFNLIQATVQIEVK